MYPFPLDSTDGLLKLLSIEVGIGNVSLQGCTGSRRILRIAGRTFLLCSALVTSRTIEDFALVNQLVDPKLTPVAKPRGAF